VEYARNGEGDKGLEPREFHWPVSAFYSRLASFMEPAYMKTAERIQLPDEARAVFEAGAGDGRFSVALARTYPHLEEIVASDIAKDMARRAGKRAEMLGLADRIRPDVQDVQALTFKDSSFDAAVSLFSMHHWPEPELGLREMDRVLKPGGLLAVVDGFGRPSLREIHSLVQAFGGSLFSALAFCLGSKDTLQLDELETAVQDSGLSYIEMILEGPIALLRGEKPSIP
jgi:ubiquinone/menaquinone biosynthesis C-methylase UbiE